MRSMLKPVATVAWLGILGIVLWGAPAGASPFAYVTNSTDNTVSVIDTANSTVIATIPVGAFPQGVAISPDGTHTYVTNSYDNTVSVIDTGKNSVVATIPVGTFPFGVAVTPSGTQAYVTNVEDSTVSVINTVSNTVSTTIPVAVSPFGVAVAPIGGSAYVAVGDTVAVVDTTSNAISATIQLVPIPTPPEVGLSITPDGVFAYVAAASGVSVIQTSTNTPIAVIPQGDAYEVATAPGGSAGVVQLPGLAYVTSPCSPGCSIVSAFDPFTDTETARIPVGDVPLGLAINPAPPHQVYVTIFSGNNVSVIGSTTNKVDATIPVGNGPIGVAFTPVVLSASQEIDMAKSQVQQLPVNEGQKNALTAKLTEAEGYISAGNTPAACDSLTSFLNQLKALKLNPSSTVSLLADIQTAEKLLGC